MKTLNKIKAFLADENGAETVEWVIVAGIMSLIAFTYYNGTLGAAVSTEITNITGRMK